jgi:tRNA pseudouridine65 synthase
VLSSTAVLYQDDDLLAINKPAGTPVHGSRILADKPDTLMALARDHTGKMVYTVHRLDRPVSGVMVLAFRQQAQALLGRQFELRQTRKCYLAVVRGWPDSNGVISHALQPPRDERTENSAAREAITVYERIARVEIPLPVHPYATSRYSLLALYPETGRRHQLRRHLKHISHHIIGDTTYGRGEHNRLFREAYACRRLLLHAWSLDLHHPVTGEPLGFHAPLDANFGAIVHTFDWKDAIETWASRKTVDHSSGCSRKHFPP